ncbi:MAG: DUF1731 domain-containing protein [Actinomycetota bacterium]
MLEIGALLLQTETDLLLKSRWVAPTRLAEDGFRLEYPTLEAALTQIVSAPGASAT